MIYKKSYGKELEKILAKVAKNKKLLGKFLADLLSPTEYKDLSVRWQIVKQLKKGIPHRKIAKSLKVSVATITRGSRELSDKKGGFSQILKKYHNKKRLKKRH